MMILTRKKQLRINAWDDIVALNLAADHLWYLDLSKKGTVYKMKTFEIAKPGKPPRMIGDLGVHASLQGFRLTSFMKKAMAKHVLNVGGGQIHFCPTPTPSALETVFNNLITPAQRFYFVLFSDDSCLSIRTKDGRVLRFNVDISSCDASHTYHLFEQLKNLFPGDLRAEVQQLIDQCRTTIEIYDLFNRKRKVKLIPNSPRLYSGSTLTTILNNLANILIAISISQVDINCAQDVIDAAKRVGYIVTCDDCTDWHKLQFLKHSPVRCTDGVIRPLLNLGVLLRLSGTCKGDLPGTKSQTLAERGKNFQASLLRGAYPKANFKLLRNMRANAGLETEACNKVVSTMLEYKVIADEDYPSFEVDSHEVWKRYDLTPLQVAELEDDFGSCKFSDHYCSPGTAVVLNLDYGLTSASMPEDELGTFENEARHFPTAA